MHSACDKYEVREIIDNSVSKLKEWLDLRLRHHEDLMVLRVFSSIKDSVPAGNVESMGNLGEPMSHSITPLTGCADVNGVFQMVHKPSLEDSEVQMIKPAAVENLSVHADAEIEEVPLPGSAILPGSTSGPFPGYPPERVTGQMTNHMTPASTLYSSVRASKPRRSSGMDMHLQEWQSKLMDIFDQLDLDGSGTIESNEFMEAFEDVGMPDVQALNVFNVFDKTGNGRVTRLEWLTVVEEAAKGSTQDLELLMDFLDRLAVRQKQRGYLYDTDRRHRPFCILRHDSVHRMSWDMLLMVLLFYISVSVPFSLGLSSSEVLDVTDRIADMFFCCDVVLNFRTSYANYDETVVFDTKKIALKYLRTWFILDFVSSVPFDLFLVFE